MGIKNLKKILQDYCENYVTRKDLKEYKGKILAVDCSIFIYKSLYSSDDILDGMTRNILRLIRNGIIPYFVFDGKPPDAKNDLLQDRKDRKNNLIKKKEYIETIINNRKNDDINIEKIPINDEQNYENMLIEDLEIELKKVNKNIININSSHFDLLYQLLEYFGIPYIIADGEAESLCAKLYKNKKVHGCISEDSDVLVNGGKIFLRGFNPEKNYLDEYNLDIILNNLELNYEQFIDMCILCGCDYCAKINGIGPITAFKLIKSYDNIENILEYIKESGKYKVSDNFEYEKARYIFMNAFNDFDYENLKIELGEPNIRKLLDFLSNNSSNLKDKYYSEIENYLNKYYYQIKNNKSNMKQMNLFSFLNKK